MTPPCERAFVKRIFRGGNLGKEGDEENGAKANMELFSSSIPTNEVYM